MRTFMKKSSPALLLAVLVLLTGILVGTAVTASAEEVAEPEHEASVYHPVTGLLKSGRLDDLLAEYSWLGATYNYRIVLHKDAELAKAGLYIKGFSEVEGNGHTIYIDDSINVSSTTHFLMVTHEGNTVFKNINFVGQDMDWDGSVETMKAFGSVDNYFGAIQINAGNRHVEFQNCTMTGFKTLGRASCIWFTGNTTAKNQNGDIVYDASVYNNNYGLYLKDTEIVGNYAGGVKSNGSNSDGYAVWVQYSGTGYYGNKVHVSGNTLVKDNYHNITGLARSNIYVFKTGAATGIESSVLMVEEDFTGCVGMNVDQSINHDVAAGRRGCIFYVGDSFDADGKYIRQGVVFANTGDAGSCYVSPQGVSLGHLPSYLVADDETSPYGSFVGAAHGGNFSKLTDTVTLTVMDKTGTKVLFDYEVEVQNGAFIASALPTWATWYDAKYGTPSKTHANGTDYIGKVNYETGFLASTNKGVTWVYQTVMTNHTSSAGVSTINSNLTHLEAVGDYVMEFHHGTALNSTLIIDFNGYTLTRADKSYYLMWEGNSAGTYWQNITIRNIVVDGTITDAEGNTSIPTDGVTFIRGRKHATMTFENCEFKNIITTGTAKETYSSYGAAIMVNADSPITLKNVTMTNCKGHAGAFYAGAVSVYLAGNTRIGELENGAVVANTAAGTYAVDTAIAVIETFTGEVYLSIEGYGTTNQPVYYRDSKVTPTDELKARAFVAEGAEILGRIAPSGAPTTYFAYNNQGTLSWTTPGNALADTVVYDAETNTLSRSAWFYNDGTADVQTSVVIADVFNYFVKDIDMSAVEAVNATTLAYGDLKTVIAAAAAGQTVEVLRDVKGVKNIDIPGSVTIDGNGHTLTMYNTEKPAEEDAIYFFKPLNHWITIKDVVLHGGAAEVGVWDEKVAAPNNSQVFPAYKILTLDNVKITGMRWTYTDTSDRGMIFGAGQWCTNLYLNDVEITDNIFNTPNGTSSATYGLVIRMASSVATFMSGKCVVKDNFRIVPGTEEGTVNYYPANFKNTNQARLVIGELAEGSRIHVSNGINHAALINAETGLPYNYSGMIFRDRDSFAMAADKILTSGYYYSYNYLVWDGVSTTTVDGKTVAMISVNTTATLDTANVQGGGGIDSDRLAMIYYIPITADRYATDVVVAKDGEEIWRKNLSELTLKTDFADGKARFVIDGADIGMAELTDTYEIYLRAAGTDKVLNGTPATYEAVAKTYLMGLLAGEYDNEMKAAVASLLRYGAKVQTFFKHNLDNLAMTADDEAAWIAAGYLEEIGDGLKGGESVQAFGAGSVAGVELYGATLTMENQMSLRLYFTADSIEGLTFKVGGEAVEVMEGNGMYYIEASHIGTANLAAPVEFEIASVAETLTYTASPMSYVFAVFATENSQITQELKDACEALYYYFVAAGAYFNFNTDIGFTSALVVSLDPVNAYSIPYGITAA